MMGSLRSSLPFNRVFVSMLCAPCCASCVVGLRKPGWISYSEVSPGAWLPARAAGCV